MVSCKDLKSIPSGVQAYTFIAVSAAHMFRLMGVGRLGSIGLWLLILMLCIRQLTRHFSALVTPSASEHERLLEGRAGLIMAGYIHTLIINWKSEAKTNALL